MPSIINATLTNGLVTSADNSGSLQLQTNNGTTAVTIDTSQNVGIGTTSPAYKLDVSGGHAQIRGGQALFFGNSANNSLTGIYNAGSSGSSAMAFETPAGTERMRITSGGDLQFNSGYGSVATAYGCRAWVNFNGTGTPAIRASGNVSSITDNGLGDYTVNFTTAMPNVNYVTNATCIDVNFGGVMCIQSTVANYATSSVRVLTFQKGANAYFDAEIACVSIFR